MAFVPLPRSATPWTQPPKSFAECNFKLACERRQPAASHLPQGPWRPPSNMTLVSRPAESGGGRAASADRARPPSTQPQPPARPASARSAPRAAGAHRQLRQQTATPLQLRRPASGFPKGRPAGLTSVEVAGLGADSGAVVVRTSSRATPEARHYALRLSAQEKLVRQARNVARVLRAMIAAKRSCSGKPMACTIISAFEAMDADGSGKVDADEFERALSRLGLGLTPKQLDQLLVGCDSDGDGSVR